MSEASLHLPHSTDAPIAGGSLGPRTVADLHRDAAVVGELLPTAPGARVLLVFESDRYAFLVGLWAAWQHGHTAVIPPDTRRSTLTRLQGTAQVVLHDTPSGIPHHVPSLLAKRESSPSSSRESLADEASTELYTFDPLTGTLHAHLIRPGALLAEAQTLGKHLHIAPEDRVVSTVPLGHRYGLVAGLLGPLVNGACFSRTAVPPPETIADLLHAQSARIFVSVPAHIQTLLQAHPAPLPTLETIVSSTDRFERHLAHAAETQWNVTVYDILSTVACGSIAHRNPTVGPSWRPLPRVSVSKTDAQLMQVQAPWNGRGPPWVASTLDRIEPADDGTFTHHGRTEDDIVLQGTSHSLTALTNLFRALDDIEDAAIIAVTPTPNSEPRLLIAVVGTSWTPERLAQVWSQNFSAAVPTAIRVVTSIPKDGLGRLDRSRLCVQFGLGPDGTERRFDVEWGHQTSSSGPPPEHRFEATIPENYRWFDGHFETYPILPGAVQLHELVLPCVAKANVVSRSLTSVSQVKFNGRITPGQTLTVILRVPSQEHVDFSIVDAHGKTKAAGRLVYAAESGETA